MIHQDIAVANEKLEVPENQKYLKDNFFTSTNGIESWPEEALDNGGMGENECAACSLEPS